MTARGQIADTRTPEQLRQKIGELEGDLEEAENARVAAEMQLEEQADRHQDRVNELRGQLEDTRRVLVNHHDAERHPGPQRFCYLQPCRAFNSEST